jgi:hypothetical protein
MPTPATPKPEDSVSLELPPDDVIISRLVDHAHRYSMLENRHKLYRVLNADIEPMGKSNLKEVGQRYMRYWLNPEDLRGLKRGDLDAELDVSKGKFIKHFSDTRPHEPSIAEQMESDLAFKFAGFGEYFGYALRAVDTHEIIGFITGRKALKPGEAIDPVFLERQQRILRTGVTGGAMKYTSQTLPREVLERDIPTTMEIDTVAGEPFAVTRLLAEMGPEIINTVNTTRVNVYHLYGLHFRPALPRQMTRIGENSKSEGFFRELGAQQFAIDENPEGPSVSHIVDGENVTVTPVWSWMTAPADQFLANLQVKWGSQQRRLGFFWRKEDKDAAKA